MSVMRIVKSLILVISIFAFVGCTEGGRKTNKPNQLKEGPDVKTDVQDETPETASIPDTEATGTEGETESTSNTAQAKMLYSSIASCNEDDISTMIKNVPKSGLMDRSSYTPLIRAAKEGCVPWLKALIDHGVDINETDGLQKTALRWAVIGDKKEVVTELLNKDDIDPNIQDHEGKTALYGAVFRYHIPSIDLDTLKLLLDFEKTDVNLPDVRKNTPLMVAIRVRPVTKDPEEDKLKYISSKDVVELFLAHPKIDISLKNDLDSTALDLAKMANNAEVINMLEAHQAKTSLVVEGGSAK